MGESRTLWEIGLAGATIRDLRMRLGLDSGYLSRVLASLERQGLVDVRPSPADGRVRVATLTRPGRTERALLDRRSDQVAQRFFEPLDAARRERLLTAMSDVERLLRASMVTYAIEDPADREAWGCIEQYVAELGRRFESGFDPARSISAEAGELRLPNGLLLIARLRGKPIGCGALKFHGRAPAELKRMWVSPEVRGLGVGRRLLRELERQAQKHRIRAVRLETNRALREAIELYRSAGYREVPAFNAEPYADHWFEKTLG